jgi:hypothetical protein
LIDIVKVEMKSKEVYAWLWNEEKFCWNKRSSVQLNSNYWVRNLCWLPSTGKWYLCTREATFLTYKLKGFFKTEDHIFGLGTHLQHHTVPSSTVVNLSLNIHDKWNSSLMTFHICLFRYQEHLKVAQRDWWYRRNGFLFDENDQAGGLSVHTSDMYSGGARLKFCLKHTCPYICKFSSLLLIKCGNSRSN